MYLVFILVLGTSSVYDEKGVNLMVIKNNLCNICKSTSLPLVNTKILNKYNVQYYSCTECGFIQTETPYWLDEAYSSAIARSDIGLVRRNIKLSNFCSAFIPMFFNPNGRFVDYGGGNGMFVRLMRDIGYDFYWQDKFAQNQFAVDFDLTDKNNISLVTAFEVFEHLSQPISEIESMFEYSDTIVFTTRLLPRWGITPDEWWYFTPDTGQHISLYSKESLEWIAKRFNLRFSSNGISLHLLSTRSFPAVILKALSYLPFALFMSGLLNINRESFLDRDYYKITGRNLS